MSVLSGAPYGYRYISKDEGGGEAHYQIVFEEARIVKQIYEWVGRDGLAIAEVCRRLQRRKIRTAHRQEVLGSHNGLGNAEKPCI